MGFHCNRPVRIRFLIILLTLLAVVPTLSNIDVKRNTADNRNSNTYRVCELCGMARLSLHKVEDLLQQCIEVPMWPQVLEVPWSKHWAPDNNITRKMSHRNLKYTEGCFAMYKERLKSAIDAIPAELILFVVATLHTVAYSAILLLLFYMKQNSIKAMKHIKKDRASLKMRVIVSGERLPLKGRKNVVFEHTSYTHEKVDINRMKYGNSGKIDWLFQVFEDGWRNVGEYIVYSVFQRLASFRPLCDSELSVSPIQLANAGFRYLSEKSVYECEGCGNEVSCFTSQPTDPLYHRSSCQYMKSNSEELTSVETTQEATGNTVEAIAATADVSKQATKAGADTSNAESLHTEQVACNNDNEEVVYGATAASLTPGQGRERQTSESSNSSGYSSGTTSSSSSSSSGASVNGDDVDDLADGDISEPEHSECNNPDKVKPILGLECTKNTGHYAYFPAGMLDLQYIPSQCRFPDVLNFLKEACKLVVRVVVNENSTRRPKNDPSRSKLPRVGTGSCFERVADIAADSETDQQGRWTAVTKRLKKNKSGRIYVETNRHIVFDDYEAQKTTVEFFYDHPNRKEMIKFKGVSLVRERRAQGDSKCILVCKTNLDFVERLNKIRSDVMARIQNFSQPIKEALTKRIFVIAHPHGAEKVLSYGDCVMVKYSLESKQRDGKTVCTFAKINNQQQELTSEDVANHGNPASDRSTFQDNMSRNSGGDGISSFSEVPKCPVFTVFGQPSYPAYVSYDSRWDSFAEWNYGHIHDPVTLTEAGFFYAGYADCVRCFQCGLGLRSWKPGDDVYSEHHKHRPTCSYLQMQMRVKGITDPASRQQTRESNNNTETRATSYSTDGISSGHQDSNTTSNQATGLHGGDLVMEQKTTSFVPQPHPQEQVVGYAFDSSSNLPGPAASALKQDTDKDGNVSRPSAAAANGNTNTKNLARTLLERENKILQKQLNCKICQVNPIKDLFLPCGELYACTDCSKLLTHCPSCNKKILATVTTYFT